MPKEKIEDLDLKEFLNPEGLIKYAWFPNKHYCKVNIKSEDGELLEYEEVFIDDIPEYIKMLEAIYNHAKKE